MQHGLCDFAVNFYINSEDKAPAFILANQCYDVWLPNSRGTIYSVDHLELKKEDLKF